MTYFARRIYVTDYPHSLAPGGGEWCWCVRDSRGGFWVAADEQTAIAEAARWNARSVEVCEVAP